MSDNYISVSQLNSYIKGIFDAEVMLQNISVFGEVSSYSISGGNAYFNLKDEFGMLSCVLFGANRYEAPNVGDMVLVSGSMNYYAKGGKLSFNAYSIVPYGKGLLYEKFLKLKAELENRGYFDVDRKKPIPQKVKRIGVVSSETGAVIRDIIDVTHRRNDSIDIVLYPVKVQGLGAEREIATGIDFFSNYDNVDVVIVARGGGSMEDLEPFNTEIVANAVYNCKKPLVSAVGHETDFTIIDFVSDLRAPTPSAAAELVAWDKSLEVENIYSSIRFMQSIVESNINDCFKNILSCMNRIGVCVLNNITVAESQINSKIMALDKVNTLLVSKESIINNLITKIEAYNPSKILNMGYSKVIKNGKVIKTISDIKSGDDINISMVDGVVSAIVK